MIRSLESQLGKESPEKFKEYLKKEIGKLEREQLELEQQAKTSVSESLILTGYLDSLISKKIKKIRLYLNKSTNFIIDIRGNRSGIKILIPNLKGLRNGLTIHEEKLQHFLGIGFELDKNQNKLSLLLVNQDKEKLLRELKIIISKIVFEIFYFKEFEGETFVEIHG
jgi:hypothetical protein